MSDQTIKRTKIVIITGVLLLSAIIGFRPLHWKQLALLQGSLLLFFAIAYSYRAYRLDR